MEQLEQALQRRKRGRAGVGITVVEPRLDRLRVPVAEIVEREAIQRVCAGGELESAPELLELGSRGIETGEDPLFLQSRGRSSGQASAAFARISRATFQSLFANLRPSSMKPTEKRTSWVDDIFRSP